MTMNGAPSRTPGMYTSNMLDRARNAQNNELNALHQIIQEHLKAPGDLANLLSGSNFDDESKILAMASLVERGMRRYSPSDREKIQNGQKSYFEANYPVRASSEIMLAEKSINGFGTTKVVEAIVGSMGIPKDHGNEDRAQVVIENK